jgi:hypothetical protein
LLVVAFPQGIVGYFNHRLGRYFDDNYNPSGSLE